MLYLVHYPNDGAPIATLVGPTEHRAVTLITCTGAFDEAFGRYFERRVVRAERTVADTDPEAAAGP